jgi:enolase
VEEREVDDQHRQESVNAAVNILNSDINNRMHDINPSQQDDVDSIIMYVYNYLYINTSA